MKHVLVCLGFALPVAPMLGAAATAADNPTAVNVDNCAHAETDMQMDRMFKMAGVATLELVVLRSGQWQIDWARHATRPTAAFDQLAAGH